MTSGAAWAAQPATVSTVQAASCVVQMRSDGDRFGQSNSTQMLSALLTSTSLVDPAAKLVGKSHLYVLSRSGRGEKPKTRQPPDDAIIAEHGDARGYSNADRFSCFDPMTGDRIWTRRIAGSFKFAVADNDDLWAQSERLLRLDGTGRIAFDKTLNVPNVYRLAGLIDGASRLPLSVDGANEFGSPAAERGGPGQWLDVQSGTLKEILLPEPRLSPSGAAKLVMHVEQSPRNVTTTIEA